ncbi:hypothetical protein [Desulfonatronovibrio hydrogenovorans]|uniref:hypothetical protein n=1 Tax=Desulfonatronovibrio hydrogenovorans TaxID=53245 RepID=UPI00049177BA|nr:hypothetical protein [Desulfonatronovibrio hydrogenovorans]
MKYIKKEKAKALGFCKSKCTLGIRPVRHPFCAALHIFSDSPPEDCCLIEPEQRERWIREIREGE